MNFKSHAQSLAEFIVKHTPMWKKEIMNEYPDTIKDYPAEWIELLDSLSESELFDVDCKRVVAKLQGSSFLQWTQEISQLSNIPFIPESPEIPLEDWAFQGVKKKKRHEIQKIVPVLKQVKEENSFDYVVDIGGGVGHLSRVLSHYHGIASISIDQNSEFQKIGLERLSKYRKLDGAKDVTFMNLTFGKNEDQADLLKVFHQNSLGLGLHTCGALANTLIKSTVDFGTRGILSFGCCYHRLNPEADFPMSEYFQKENFPSLNLFGLTLATRSHAEMTLETYRTKERVKYYRYALHLFLMKHFNKSYFTAVGECLMSLYFKPFHHYAMEKLSELNLKHDYSAKYIDDFYSSSDIQKELRVMFLCNIIRWQMGRVLEIYLLVDRALFLEEKGYKVSLLQYFDESLSPRNLGILALR